MKIKKGSLVESEIGEDLLIFNTSEQKFFAINITGKIAWANFFTSEDIKYILKAFKKAYGDNLNEKEVKEDIALFIESLAEVGLIKESDSDKDRPSADRGHINTSRLTKDSYEKPVIQEIPIDWLKKHHPSALLDTNFSDVWSPATDSLVD